MAASGLFSAIGGTLENGVSAYVNNTSAALSSALVPVVTTAATLWILAYGLAVMRGEASESIPTFAWRAVKVAIILAIALGSGTYQSDVINDVESGTGAIAQVIQQAGGSGCGSGIKGASVALGGSSPATIYSALDCFDTQVEAIGAGYIQQAANDATSLHISAAISDVLFAAIAVIGCSIFEIVMMFDVVLARLALALIFGIGPIFIACGAFEPTRRFFDAWISKVANYSLLQVLVAAFLGLSFSAFSAELTGMLGSANSGDITSLTSYFVANIKDDSLLLDAVAMFTTGILLAMLGWQLPSLASGLAGGASISGATAFAAGMAGRAVSGWMGAAFGKAFKGDGGGAGGGSISPTGSGGGSGSGMKPAFQRAVLDNLNRATADR